jgi:hypothetical protein
MRQTLLLLAISFWQPPAKPPEPPPPAAAVARPVLAIIGPPTVRLGDKLVLRSDPSLDAGSWDISLPADRVEYFPGAVCIWPERAGMIRSVLTVATVEVREGKAVVTSYQKFEHVTTVSGGSPGPGRPSDPGPGDPADPGGGGQVPGDYEGLRGYTQQAVQTLIPAGADRRVESAVFAGLFMAIAGRAALGKYPNVAALQADHALERKKIQDRMTPARLALWGPVFQAGGPIANKLDALGRAGKLATVAEVQLAWVAIGVGLAAVE